MKAKTIIDSFLNPFCPKAGTRQESASFLGNDFFSYDTKIAELAAGGDNTFVLKLNSAFFSQTTSRIQKALRQAVEAKGIKIAPLV